MAENPYVSPVLERIRQKQFADDLQLAYDFSLQYINQVNEMRVYPAEEDITNLHVFEEELGEEPTLTAEILKMLHKYGTPATVAQTGGRYFGFVIGGILPSALCTKWLSDTWDQNSALFVMSPVTSKIEEVCERWLKDLFRLPAETVAGFVSGTSTATLCGLIAGRNHLLQKQGHDVIVNGLFHAPEIKVVLGESAHSTVYKALSILGLGNERIVKVPADEQGRIIVEALPELDERTLLIIQAGNVNTGSFDHFRLICEKANAAGAWVHVDGAFGLWAAACDKMRKLTDGIELADSWSVDAHKTLNAPYDNGIILCKHKDTLVNAMHMTGSYIIYNTNRDGMLYTTDMSRRSRALELWATFKGLGKNGVSELVWELHSKAKYFAELLQAGSLEILNKVVFNQVLAYYESDTKTEALLQGIQQSGVCWLGGARWAGKSVLRISVCSYKTTYEDIEKSANEILRIANTLRS